MRIIRPWSILLLYLAALVLLAVTGADLGALLLHSFWAKLGGALLLPALLLVETVVFLSKHLGGFD